MLPAATLKKIFAVVLLIVAINVLLDAYQLKPGSRRAEPVGATAAQSEAVQGQMEAGPTGER